MGINFSGVDWMFLGLMTGLAFVAALLGSLIAFRNRFVGAILAGILFGVGFVFWNYYPHNFGLPILKTTAPDSTMTSPAVTTPPAAMAPSPMSPTPMAPTSPVTTLPASPPPSQMTPANPGSAGSH
jgi:hypothetical protein